MDGWSPSLSECGSAARLEPRQTTGRSGSPVVFTTAAHLPTNQVWAALDWTRLCSGKWWSQPGQAEAEKPSQMPERGWRALCSRWPGDQWAAVVGSSTKLSRGAAPHLPQLGHGLAGDDLVAVEPRDKAEGLELALAPLQLPQDQGTENLHLLTKTKTQGEHRLTWSRSPWPSASEGQCGETHTHLFPITSTSIPDPLCHVSPHLKGAQGG